jgi:multiple sugar transport system ATP-binding protein
VASLSLEDVSKVYGNGVEAVKHLDLDVADGEFVVLVGPSGCGKTTVLRMVAGLEEITDGTIRLDGRVANDLSPRDRDVAMVFQNYALYPHLNVHQNIAFSLSVRGVGREERDRRVREAAQLLGLGALLAAKPRHLSGGQRQRVAMGRALVRDPAIFLMDEPLSNLDASLRVQMRAEVLQIQRRLGVATLYVTHDQTEAMTMGDRVAVMRDGALQQLAPPREIYDSPANLFVAAFMGSPSMNLYEAALADGAEGPVLVLGWQRLSLAGTAAVHRAQAVGAGERAIVVGIRPEDLSPASPQVGDEHALTVGVELVEALGNEQLLHFSIDAARYRDAVDAAVVDGAHPVASGISDGASGTGVARVDPRLTIAMGARLRLAVDVDRLHFFDRDSGAALSPPPVREVARA